MEDSQQELQLYQIVNYYFLENAVSKMKPEGSKIAIIHNGSALFKG